MLLDFSTTRHVFNPFLLTSALIPEPRAAFCQWFEDFGRRLAPADLGNVPLYVVDAALAGPGDTLGFAGGSLDLAYRRQIGQRWRGRGACFALDLQQVQIKPHIEDGNEEAQKGGFYSPGPRPRLARIRSRAPAPPAVQSRFRPGPDGKGATLLHRDSRRELPDCDVAWSGHDGQFLRRAVTRRIPRQSCCLASPSKRIPSLACISPIARRGIPPGNRRRAQRTGRRAAYRSSGDVPPRPFIELWRGDVERWFQPLALPSRFQIAAREAALSLFQE